MRLRVSFLLVALFLFGTSVPVWAHTISARIDLVHAAKVVNVKLKPGNYRLLANESTGQVKIEHRFKVVARVKGKWVKIRNKSQYSEVLMNNHKIQEVRFAGKVKAVKFSS